MNNFSPKVSFSGYFITTNIKAEHYLLYIEGVCSNDGWEPGQRRCKVSDSVSWYRPPFCPLHSCATQVCWHQCHTSTLRGTFALLHFLGTTITCVVYLGLKCHYKTWPVMTSFAEGTSEGPWTLLCGKGRNWRPLWSWQTGTDSIWEEDRCVSVSRPH